MIFSGPRSRGAPTEAMADSMHVKDFLAPTDAVVDLRAADKARLLQELARRAAAALDLPEKTIAEALAKREEIGSTGTGDGVALPHARLADLKKPFGMLMRLRQAVDFDAVDGKPVDLVFLLLAPAAPQGEQLNALACAARALRTADALRRLRDATNGAQLYAAITSFGKC
jgi:PTS system nitrogen regulatory IIA component